LEKSTQAKVEANVVQPAKSMFQSVKESATGAASSATGAVGAVTAAVTGAAEGKRLILIGEWTVRWSVGAL
jgi:hypothetical protein